MRLGSAMVIAVLKVLLTADEPRASKDMCKPDAEAAWFTLASISVVGPNKPQRLLQMLDGS